MFSKLDVTLKTDLILITPICLYLFSNKKRWRGDIVKNLIKKPILKIYKLLFGILGGILPKDKKMIIFESFLGMQYSDNPRAIYEYMIKHKSKYNMYWSFEKKAIKSFENEEIKRVRRFSLKWLFLMTRAKYWVSNSRLPLWIPKPKQTVYVQTWHGTPLKLLADDMHEVHMPGISTEIYKRNFLQEAKKWDFLISPNEYSTKIFKRAFQFNKVVIESGYPRNDFLFQSNTPKKIQNLKNKNNLPIDKRVILYAPTWRDTQFYGQGKYKIGLEMDLERLRKEFGDKYIIILRLHYLIEENIDLTEYESFIFDFSYYKDIRELYVMADLLITDYSSVFFDYANLRRPMLFYIYDLEDYRDNIRGFYFDFESKAPGPLVKTTEEMIKEIKRIEGNSFQSSKEMEEFYRDFCNLEDGNATRRVVGKIFN